MVESPAIEAKGAATATHPAVARTHIYDHLSDRFDQAEVNPPLPAHFDASRAGGQRNLPFLHSPLGPARRDFHRKVIARQSRIARSDVRDGLVLPFATCVRYNVELLPRSTLRFWVEPLSLNGQTPAVPLRVEVAVPGKPAVIWRETRNALRLSLAERWPDWQQIDLAELGHGPATVSLQADVSAVDKSTASGLRLLWGDLRLEAMVDPIAPDSAPSPLRRIGPGSMDNVLLLMVDALRCDAVGHQRKGLASISPHIDSLEASGVTFSQTFANANTTLLSCNQLFTGQLARAGGFFILRPPQGGDLRPRFYASRPPFLSRLLRAHGYATALIAHNHMFFQSYEVGIDPGFDEYFDWREEDDSVAMADEAIAWITRHRAETFFLTLFLVTTHTPYSPPPEFLAKAEQAVRGTTTRLHPKYLGEVAYADVQIGRVIQSLEELGLRQRTLVVLTADHGEVMSPEHQCHSQKADRSCLYSHGLTMYDEELCVPILFSQPGRLPAGALRDGLVEHIDIAPTILDAVGLAPEPRMSGRSLLAQLLGQEAPSRRPFWTEFWRAHTVRADGWKYIVHDSFDDACTPAGGGCGGGPLREEIYDLNRDPEETRNLVATQPEQVRRLRDLYRRLREEKTRPAGSAPPTAGATKPPTP